MKREAWLKLVNEEPIDPGLPICDPHHHLWDYPDHIPDDNVPPVVRPFRHYLLGQLLADTTGGHNIVQTAFIECHSMYRNGATKEMRPVGETEFVQGIAAQSASGRYGSTQVAAGIVGFADLTLGDAIEPVLEAHISASQNRFRGIRYRTIWDASSEINSTIKDPNLLASLKFREGFGLLHKYKLSFDAWLYHAQLPGLVALARDFPDTTIILNHTGGPLGIGPYSGKRDEVFQDWKGGITALSCCPNVYIKLGGLGMPMTGFGWHKRPTPPNSKELAIAMEPYFYWCIERFGTNRCMFESNFPVDRISYSYTILWNTFKLISRNYSLIERAELFYNTAVHAYRLPH